MSTVLVSGASGFVALHILGELLSQGFKVIGTVRNQSKIDKLNQQFSKINNHENLSFVIVNDIAAEGAFDEVFQNHPEIEFVLHTASPFGFGLGDDLDAIYRTPAVNGTLNMLQSVHKFGKNVKKVVVTSSMAAIENADKIDDETFYHTESVWNPIEWENVGDNQNLAYVASKKLAEKAAWEFLESNPDVKFDLNTVNPPFIFGPQFFDEDAAREGLNTSASVIGNLLKTNPNDTKLFNGLALCAVDVRDVAKFHVLSLQHPEIIKQRLFPSASRFSEQGILNIINEKIPQLNGKIAKGDPSGESSIKTPRFNNELSVKLLGDYEFIPLEKQVTDAVNQILNATAKAKI